MSATIQGNVIEITGAAAATSIKIVSLRYDVVAGFQLVKGGQKTLRSDDSGNFTVTLAAGDYEVLINKVNRYVINVPDDDNTYQFADRITESATLASIPPGSLTPSARLAEMAQAGSFTLTSATLDGQGVLTSATVRWPDGATGTLTVTATSGDLVSGYTVTHSLTGKTVTQPAVTLNANGDITAQPAITVS